MAAELFRRGLSDHRRALAGWCVGIAAYVALVSSIFSSIQGSPELNDLVANYPEALKSLFGITGGGNITTGAGYLDVELFSFMLPLLILVLAISSGLASAAPAMGDDMTVLLERESCPLLYNMIASRPQAPCHRAP